MDNGKPLQTMNKNDDLRSVGLVVIISRQILSSHLSRNFGPTVSKMTLKNVGFVCVCHDYVAHKCAMTHHGMLVCNIPLLPLGTRPVQLSIGS